MLAFSISDIQVPPRKVRANKPAMESRESCPTHFLRLPFRNLCPGRVRPNGRRPEREFDGIRRRTYHIKSGTIRRRSVSDSSSMRIVLWAAAVIWHFPKEVTSWNDKLCYATDTFRCAPLPRSRGVGLLSGTGTATMMAVPPASD